jgi:RHS repeat-associated protein
MAVTSDVGRVTVGHPVSVATGVVFTAWHDFEFPGPWDMTWSRFYSTADVTLSPLGRGWQSPFFMHIREELPLRVLAHDDGEVEFLPDPVTQAIVNSSHGMELFKEGDRYRIWAWQERTNYYFDQAGPARPGWRLSETVRRTGHRSRFAYDPAGRLTSIDQFPLRRVEISYNPSGLIERVELLEPTRPPVFLVQYLYDTQLRLTAVIDGSGAAIRYGYDSAHRLISETNRLGATFHFEYDDQGRCVHTFGDGGFNERYLSYDTVARRTRVRDRQGTEWLYDMDARGLVVREQDPLGAVWKHTFDQEDRLVLTESPLGHFLMLAYDAVGHLAATTDGMGRTSRFEYGPLHLPITQTHADGSVEAWEYDAFGNLTARTNEAGDRWRYERDAQGRLAAAITPRGHRTDLTYAPDGRSHELRDAFGWIRFEYDARGELVRQSDSVGVRDTFTYDTLGRLTAITHADGSTFLFSYDVDGNVTSDTDELGRVTRYVYDRLGAVIEKINPDGTRLRMFHDSEGRMTALENEHGERCTFVLDALGTVVAQTFFDGRTETYSFDPCGQLIGIGKPDGTDVRYTYDAVGRTLTITAGDLLLARFEYDARERIITADSPAGAVQFEYNAVGGVTRESQGGHVVELEYDAEGNNVAQHYASGPAGKLRLEYDLRRRLIGVSDDKRTLQRFEYDARDQLVRRISAGPVEERRGHDNRGRMVEQEVRADDGTTLVRRVYRYDAADGLVERADSRWGQVRYRYDARDRLVEQARPALAPDAFTYDACGNLQTLRGAPLSSLANRLLATPRRRYRYNANGLITDIQDARGTTALSYDPLERLVRVTSPAGVTTLYGYDAFTRRVVKQGPAGATTFVWAGHQLRAERRPDGTLVEYLNVRFNPLAQWSDGAWCTVVTDQMLVPREILDRNGRVAWRMDYDGFGAVTAEEGAGAPSPFRLPGQYADAETGFYQNRFRYYDPETSRFIQPDPIGLFGGMNEYRYADNAVNFRDPLGLKCKLVHFKIKVNPKVGSQKDYIAKRDAFNQARQNQNARIPTKQNYDNNIRPAADREAAAARAAGGFTSSQDADHPGDVRATGLLGQQLQPLDSGVNRSVGSQVGSQIRNDPSSFPAGQRTPMMDLVDQNGNPIP